MDKLTFEEIRIKIKEEDGALEEWAKTIKTVAEEQMEAKEVTIKGIVELKCFKSNGVETVKNILNEAKKKYDLEIKYVSAPKYSLSLRTKDAKAGERKIKEALEEMVKNIKELGGEGSFKVE